MSPILILLLATIALIVLSAYAVLRRAEDDPLQQRLMEYGARDQVASLSEVEMSMSFTDRVLVPLARSIANIVSRFTPQRSIESTAHKLEIAGLSRRMTASDFWSLRIVCTVGLTALVFFIMWRFDTEPSKRALYALLMGVLGYILPSMWLSSTIQRRQRGIIRSLPDALDLLTICVEAGLGFDSAMRRVATKWSSDLSHEFGRVLQEIQLGMVRRDALRAMSARLEVADVTTFIAAVVQAEQLGVSLSRVLRIQSDQMRIRRRQRAEKAAHEAPVKMVFPLVFLIFPSILIVLLGPALFQILRTSEVFQVFG